MSGTSTNMTPLDYRYLPVATSRPASRSTRASLITIFFLAGISVSLPYVRPNLDTVRWVMLCTVILSWLIFNVKYLFQPALPRWLIVYLALYVTMCMASSLWSANPVYTLTRGISLALLFVFLSVFATIVRRYRCESVACTCIALYGTLLLLPGLVLERAGVGTVPWTYYPIYLGTRYAGILWNPNQIAVTVVTMFPVLFALWWKGKVRRLWAIPAMVVFVVSLLLCGSRAGFVGFLVGLFAFFAVNYRLKWFVPGAAAVLLVGWTSLEASPALKTKVEQFIFRSEHVRMEDVSVAEASKNRMLVWTPVLQQIRQRPFFGWGFAMGGAQLHRREVQAHNSYLQVAQELGLFGLAFFMVLVLALLYALFKLVILHAPVPDRVLYSGFAGVVAGGLVNAFFESWLFSVGNLGAMPFWACAFLVLSVNRTDSHGRPLKQETKKKTGRPA